MATTLPTGFVLDQNPEDLKVNDAASARRIFPLGSMSFGMPASCRGLGDRIELPTANPTRTQAEGRKILRANLETGKPS